MPSWVAPRLTKKTTKRSGGSSKKRCKAAQLPNAPKRKPTPRTMKRTPKQKKSRRCTPRQPLLARANLRTAKLPPSSKKKASYFPARPARRGLPALRVKTSRGTPRALVAAIPARGSSVPSVAVAAIADHAVTAVIRADHATIIAVTIVAALAAKTAAPTPAAVLSNRARWKIVAAARGVRASIAAAAPVRVSNGVLAAVVTIADTAAIPGHRAARN